MKIRGAVLAQMGLPPPYAHSRPLEIAEVELAPPGPGELLLRIDAAGLCHSDLSVIDGSRPRPMPMLLGHEAAGTVIGSRAACFAAGDRVVLAFVPACGGCLPCAEGRPALCETGAAANTAGTLLDGGRRLALPLHHHLGISGFATHAVVSARSAIRIDADIEPAIAALFGCAVLTGVGAVVNTARVVPGTSVAVFGLGGVGLAAVLGAVAAGAHPIVAVDPVPARRAAALALGASYALPPGPDGMAELRALTQGGAAAAIEAAGQETVLADAYAATRRGGITIATGLPDPSRILRIPAVSLVGEERTLRGSYMGSAVPARDLPRFIGLYLAGRLPVDRLLTHRLSLDGINEGFDRLAAGEGVRQVVVF